MRVRWYGSFVCGLALVWAGTLRADDQAEARPVLDKALKAMGGDAKLAKLKTGTAKGKMTGQESGQELVLTFEASWQGLSQYRLDVAVTVGARNMQALLVINGDKGWAKHGDRTDDAPAEILPLIKNGLYALRLPQVLPALKDPAYKLSPLGEAKVGERTAAGLVVTHKDYKDVNLFFDKENGLPLKAEIRLTGPDGKEIMVEYVYGDYKEFAGVKHPAKVTIKADDKELTMQIEQIKAEDKLDESLFVKP
jgi:hypothetical protein